MGIKVALKSTNSDFIRLILYVQRLSLKKQKRVKEKKKLLKSYLLR